MNDDRRPNRATILTDFGTRDGYVAAMKGIIASIAPAAIIDDATHDIPQGDILAAAFALRRYWRHYPKQTVHLVVVDPGVGTERGAIAMEADGRYFVGPDNGVFTFIPADHVVELEVPAQSSHTFHGRDVFAPAAARLLAGSKLSELGKETFVRVALEIPQPHAGSGEVIAVDRFGNVITNLTSPGDVTINGEVIRLRKTYGDVDVGQLLALINSDGLLEIAVRNGSAAETLGVSRGALVELRL
jgi:S-adenosyl-L-methionine hydrolase (adenosine-forming)